MFYCCKFCILVPLTSHTMQSSLQPLYVASGLLKHNLETAKMKTSSPLKKLKVKSPKELIFTSNKRKENEKKNDNNNNNNEEKETTDNSSSSSFIYGDDLATPTLSNTTKKLNVDNGGFPTLPALQGENDNNDNDEDSVAAMSDILDRSLANSPNSLDSIDYYKQDYYDNTLQQQQQQVDHDNNASLSVTTSQAVIGEGMDVDHQSTAVAAAKDNNADEKQFDSPGRKSPEINDNNKTPPPSSIRLTSPSKHTTPESKVTFAHDNDDDEKSFNSSNLKTPPHLHRIDVFATPDKDTNNSNVGSPMTPLEQLQTPGGSTNAPRVLKQNKKLRASKKELLKLLGSTAKQYSTYEEIASQKIFELEGRIRSLEKELQQQQTMTTTTDSVRKDDDVGTKDDSITTDESNNINHPKEISLEGWAERQSYDPETVRNLSSSIMEKEKQLYMKEKFISSLKLRCETLKHCLTETGDALEQSKLAWEEERRKLVDKLGANSPMRLEHGTIMSLKMENTHLKKELDCALNDVDMLSDALEKNNEALDHSVSQLERLRKWKIEHDQMDDMRAVSESMQSAVEENPRDKNGEESDSQQQQQHLHQQQQLLQELDTKREEMRKGLEATIFEKEQQIGMMEENLKEKSLEIIQLQTDLESCFIEIEGQKELVNKTAAAKGYEDFQSMVENLRDNATKSEIKATAFNERISMLESELQEKKTEIVQLSMSHSNEDGETKSLEEGESVNEAPPSETNYLNQCSSDGMEGTSINFSPGAMNSPSSLASNSLGASTPTESRRESGLSFLRTKLKEGRQYAAAVGNSGDPESMMAMIRERDQKINALEATIEPNILMTEKLTKDIERMDTEHQEAMLQSKLKIEQLEEENALYLQQVEGFERAFMSLNESQQSSLLPKLDHNEEANTPEESVESDKDDAASDEDEERGHLKLQKLERIVSQLRDESSFQEDQIEKLKTELITLRVVSQQEKDTALDKLRDENKIIVAQRSALENQLIEINQSAAQIRDSLAQDTSQSSATNGRECSKEEKSGSDPILVAQVVMLKNANKVLESSVDSLRSDQQEKLAPLLERIALLEEEKRIMAEEMHTKIHCREQTISNLEESLKQATRSRLDKNKNKKNSALKLSEQLLARATRAAKD